MDLKLAGMYNLRLDDRKCPFCNSVEDETNFIFDCSLYDGLRQTIFDKAVNTQPTILAVSKQEQMKFVSIILPSLE